MKSFNIGDLQIPVPIIQGGMGIGISLSGLASAVANLGGVGVIATVGIGNVRNTIQTNYKLKHIEAIREEIRKARELTKGVLGVNIMGVLTNFSDMVQTSIEEGIDIIFSGAGLPLDLPKYLGKKKKTKLVPIVSSARAASILCKRWYLHFNYLPDAFVVEGPLAGGHLGFKRGDLDIAGNTLENLVSDVLEVTSGIREDYNKDIPVIAAGGIYSGEDIFQIMKKGATAVQMGTRFVATEECDASPEFKNAFISAKEDDIRIINSPVGLPGRAIFNQFLNEVSDGKRQPVKCSFNCIKTCDPKTTPYCIADALLAAYRGNLNNGFAFSGSNAAKVNHISTVREVFDDLFQEYNQAKGKG
ncbi:MAG: nitronate monooxygenase [Bacteroidales bacterium]|nr:nitronate monooxygenase [Bacteroidales bacterium]